MITKINKNLCIELASTLNSVEQLFLISLSQKVDKCGFNYTLGQIVTD
jgi:hypothetical protein